MSENTERKPKVKPGLTYAAMQEALPGSRVFYCRPEKKDGKQRNPQQATIVATFSNVNSDTVEVRAGFAICSGKDQFSKAIGRELAIQRYISKDPTYYITQTVVLSPLITPRVVARALVESIKAQLKY